MTKMTTTIRRQIRFLRAAGYTIREIAATLEIHYNTVIKYQSDEYEQRYRQKEVNRWREMNAGRDDYIPRAERSARAEARRAAEGTKRPTDGPRRYVYVTGTVLAAMRKMEAEGVPLKAIGRKTNTPYSTVQYHLRVARREREKARGRVAAQAQPEARP